MQRKLIVLLHLLLAVFLIDSHKCHQISSATSCAVVNLTKFSDSACKHEVPQTPEEQISYDITQMNGMIVTGECRPIDPAYSDVVKLRVDCTSDSTVRFRYYNFFGDDEACLEESATRKSTATKSELTATITARDSACTPMSDGVFYQFRIEPSVGQTEFKRRQMQGDAAQVVYPQQGYYQNPWYPYQPGPEINSPNVIADPEQVWAIPPTQIQPTVNPQTRVVRQSKVAPQVVITQPLAHPQTIVHRQQPYIQQYHHQMPEHKDPTLRPRKVLDRYADAALAVRDFTNDAVDATGDLVGRGVGRAYDYVGDVASYAAVRKRQNKYLSANSHMYMAQMNQVDKSSELGTGAIIGMIAGGVCLLALIVASVCYFAFNNKRRGLNGQNETQMGDIQNGPNFDDGNQTDDAFGNNEQTMNTTVTQGLQQNTNQKEGDLTYGSYLAGY